MDLPGERPRPRRQPQRRYHQLVSDQKKGRPEGQATSALQAREGPSQLQVGDAAQHAERLVKAPRPPGDLVFGQTFSGVACQACDGDLVGVAVPAGAIFCRPRGPRFAFIDEDADPIEGLGRAQADEQSLRQTRSRPPQLGHDCPDQRADRRLTSSGWFEAVNKFSSVREAMIEATCGLRVSRSACLYAASTSSPMLYFRLPVCRLNGRAFFRL